MFGSGPSLRTESALKHLAKEATFSCNALPEWGDLPFVPTYHALADTFPQDIDRYIYPELKMKRFWAWRTPVEHEWFQWVDYASYSGGVFADGMVGLGDTLPKIVHGGTTPLTMIQLAAWMGYREFYMVGVDITSRGQCWDSKIDRNLGHRLRNRILKSAAALRATLEASGGNLVDCTFGGCMNETRRVNDDHDLHNGLPIPPLEFKPLKEVLSAS